MMEDMGQNHVSEEPKCCSQQSHHSLFSLVVAEDAAGVLAARDLDVLLYKTVAPTPLCAFAVRRLGTAAGIVITASHNPPAYNGYKVCEAYIQ
jgi:phosphomannomutase